MRFGGLFAVNELDLNVRQGAIHSIIGPNGAGKTTVFNCIMQNLQISGGKIWFRGERVDGLTPDRIAAAGVSRTYQNIRLVPERHGHGKPSGRHASSSSLPLVGSADQFSRHTAKREERTTRR